MFQKHAPGRLGAQTNTGMRDGMVWHEEDDAPGARKGEVSVS